MAASVASQILILKSRNGPDTPIHLKDSAEAIDKIKEHFKNVEICVSGYDTAWMAMVRRIDSEGNTPQFPQCVDWILKNQKPDGSWSSHGHNFGSKKDALSSTLACVIALQKWNVGGSMRDKGIDFIMSNWSAVDDDNYCHQNGFDVIFSGMIKTLMTMGLKLPLSECELNKIFQRREVELKRASRSQCHGVDAYLAFISEGHDKFPEWGKLEKFQKKNGSIVDSPSTTAAALDHHKNAKCLNYLNSILKKYENYVPSRYYLDNTIPLELIDLLENLGISHYFANEIEDILNKTRRWWMEEGDEYTSNLSTYARAFRLLRTHGYEISPGFMARLDKESFENSLDGYREDTATVLELYKASHHSFHSEMSLKYLGTWTRDILMKKLSKTKNQLRLKQVEHALEVPSYATLKVLETRANIKHFKKDPAQNLRMSFGFSDCHQKDIISFAIEEFNNNQYTFRHEFDHFRRWLKESKLDQLTHRRETSTTCYSLATTLFSFEMADARVLCAKNGVFTTVIDDFFDVTGSKEELNNLIDLVDQWKGISESSCYSNQVKIIYSALHSTVEEIGEKASLKQGYNVTNYIINIWRKLLRAFMKEAVWRMENVVPTLEQYMENGYVSHAMGPSILPTLFLICPHLSPDTIEGPECSRMYYLLSTCGRLLNDIQSFEREKEEGKLNSISLTIREHGGTITEEGAKDELRTVVEKLREELLKMVLKKEESSLPRPCKDVFWNASRALHLLYAKSDGLSSPTDMIGVVNSILYEPI